MNYCSFIPVGQSSLQAFTDQRLTRKAWTRAGSLPSCMPSRVTYVTSRTACDHRYSVLSCSSDCLVNILRFNMCLATVPVIVLMASALSVEGRRVASDVRRELKSARAGVRA